MGRGVSRGKRDHPLDILRTRPETLGSKRGEAGNPLKLCTNYFAMQVDQDWRLYQYE